MIINPYGLIFVGKRIDMEEAWQMPQGGIDEGETAYQAVMREMEEEIGTREANLLAESHGWYKYDLPEEMIPHFWEGKYIGQRQKWFLFSMRDENLINIQTATPEFKSWKWVKPEALPDLIFPAKRKMYTDLLEEFKDFLACRF